MSKSVAGVAYGLMMETEHESQDIKRYQILTDLSVKHISTDLLTGIA